MELNHIKSPIKTEYNTVMLILQSIGIVAVVFGHADIGNSDIPNPLNLVFPYYSWHMPLFIFISGYFFNRTMPIGKYLFKKTRTLLIPALLVNAACGIFSAAIKYFEIADYGKDITLKSLLVTPFTTGYQFTIDVSLWFVFALFVIEIIACLMDRITRQKADLICLCFSLLLSLYCCYRTFFDHDGTRGEYFNAFLRFGYLLFFFWLGACYRKYLEPYIKNILNYRFAFIILFAQGVLLGITNFNITFNTRDMKLSTITVPYGFWVAIAAPLTAILFLLGIAYSLAPYIKSSKLIVFVGRNTKYVMYYHQLLFVLSSFGLAALQSQKMIPNIDGFSYDRMRETAYYAGGNSTIALLISLFSIFVPIVLCKWIERKRWYIKTLLYFTLIILVLLFLWLSSKAI